MTKEKINDIVIENEQKVFVQKKIRRLTSSIEVPIVEDIIQEEIEYSKLDVFGRASATGRRKRASARVWVSTGDLIEVNGQSFEKYFPQITLRNFILQPLFVIGMQKAKIFATTCGGGLAGQAGALRHGIARALLNFDPTFRTKLKSHGFLTRDSRKKERKTPGFRTARKPQQFSKR